MRCLVVTANDPAGFGGVERFVTTLVNNLSLRSVQFEVVHKGVTAFKFAWYDRYGLGEARQALQVSRAATAILQGQGYDLVVVNGITGWALHSPVPVINIHHGTFRGAALAMAKAASGANTARRLKRRVTVAMSHYGSGSFEALSARLATVNVAVSASTREELVGLYGIDPSRTRIIQNGVDIDHFMPLDRDAARAALGIPKNQFVALFSGRNEQRKGADKLTQLARLLQDSDPSILVVAATDQRFESPYVKTIEKAEYQDLPLLYSSADAFVFPSLYEGCSFSVIEAMACGLPVVMTDVGHARDVKEWSELLAPYIVPAESPPEQFADLILSLRRDEDARRAMSAEARRYAVQHNSVEVMVQSYLELFGEVASRTRG